MSNPEKTSIREMRTLRNQVAEVFGGRRKARVWLDKPNHLLGNETPEQHMQSKSGVTHVRNLLEFGPDIIK